MTGDLGQTVPSRSRHTHTHTHMLCTRTTESADRPGKQTGVVSQVPLWQHVVVAVPA